MAQFDSLIISSQIFSLLIILSLYYIIMIDFVIPFYSEVKKFRDKKFSEFGSSKSMSETKDSSCSMAVLYAKFF